MIDIEKLNIAPENLNSNVGFNNICYFKVVDDELRASLGAQISPAGFIGEIEISYFFEDNVYKANKIEFKKYND